MQSPRQISDALKRVFPCAPESHVLYETIYSAPPSPNWRTLLEVFAHLGLRAPASILSSLNRMSRFGPEIAIAHGVIVHLTHAEVPRLTHLTVIAGLCRPD